MLLYDSSFDEYSHTELDSDDERALSIELSELEDEIAIKHYIITNCGWDPLLHIDNNQEMIEKAAGIHN